MDAGSLKASPYTSHAQDFSKQDLVSALRQLFDTFKPGGEGQATAHHTYGSADSWDMILLADMSYGQTPSICVK